MFKSSKFKLAVLVFSSLFMFVPAAHAADLRYGGKDGVVRVQSSDFVHNLYTAGSDVIIDTNTAQDVVAAGQIVMVDGTVNDDLILAGNTVTVTGEVKGSARIAGGTVTIDNRVGEDLIVFGGTVHVTSKAAVGGDLIVFGGSVALDGPVNGSAIVRGGRISISNEIRGNAKVSASQTLLLASGAKIGGDLTYESPNMLERDPNAQVVGKINYEPMQQRDTRHFFAGFWTIAFLLKVLGLLVFAIIMFALFKKKFSHSVQKVGERFWMNVGIGFLALVVTPIVGIILLITLVGIPIAFFLLFMYIIAMFFAWVVSTAYFGVKLAQWLRLKSELNYWTILLGAVIATVLAMIPVAGFIFALVLLLAGLGAFVRLLNGLRS